jgi:hypothetical protein
MAFSWSAWQAPPYTVSASFLCWAGSVSILWSGWPSTGLGAQLPFTIQLVWL